ATIACDLGYMGGGVGCDPS
ncbi:hypothetical protein A2U01_0054979, partial [Trifolium medium]|nr:hypothetical protein [Trifolium medium]